MSRYIDSDELVKILSYMRSHHKVDIFGRHFLDCYRAGEEYLETMDDVIESVCRMPAADVEEVVRCKDCKYQNKGQNECDSWNMCEYRSWLYFPVNDEDFCSNGERNEPKEMGEVEK